MNTKERIEKILNTAFTPQQLRLEDESALHAGHAEAIRSGGGHFSLFIVSEKFNGKSALQRHRMVYDCLKKNMKEDVHALKITARTPQETGSAA